MYKRYKHIVLVTLLLISLTFTVAYPALQYEYSIDKKRSSEKELSIKIESVLEKIIISQGDPQIIYTIKYNSQEQDIPKSKINYQIIDDVGYLTIKLNDKSNDNNDEWKMQYSDESPYSPLVYHVFLNNLIPTKLDVKVGAGYSRLDLSGLRLKDISFSVGVAEAVVMCNERNPIELRTFRVNAGLGKLHAYNLGNTNFRNLYFEGGLGAYYFDLNGALRNESSMNVDIGLGTISLVVPQETGTTVFFKKGFLNSFNFNDFYEVSDGMYKNSNYEETQKRFTIKIESGLGKIKLQQATPQPLK
jgi:hypothetical protein